MNAATPHSPVVLDIEGLSLTAADRRRLRHPLTGGLILFDAPDGATVCPVRQRTNTPLQAMTLLNDPLFVKAATALSKDSALESLDRRQRIVRMWRHCMGRLPTKSEVQVLEELHQQLEAEKLLSGSDATNTLDVWFVMARTILNLDEMVTRE